MMKSEKRLKNLRSIEVGLME